MKICTGIFVTSEWIENVIRAEEKNASTIIQIANNNANKIFRFSTNKYKKIWCRFIYNREIVQDKNVDKFYVDKEDKRKTYEYLFWQVLLLPDCQKKNNKTVTT